MGVEIRNPGAGEFDPAGAILEDRDLATLQRRRLDIALPPMRGRPCGVSLGGLSRAGPSPDQSAMLFSAIVEPLAVGFGLLSGTESSFQLQFVHQISGMGPGGYRFAAAGRLLDTPREPRPPACHANLPSMRAPMGNLTASKGSQPVHLRQRGPPRFLNAQGRRNDVSRT